MLMVVVQANVFGADQKIIQLGGGNKIENSQGQIEDNVIWLNNILKKSSHDTSNYFAAGNTGEKDIALYGESDSQNIMEPLSRVYDGSDANRLIFKSNQVPDVVGSMRKNEISESLSKLLSQTTDGQDILLIYNGHGGINEGDIRKNSIKIWGDERLDVSEFDKLLDSAPSDATVRFVFPQCYSGGFFYLIYENPMSDEISTQNRCGFFSESPYEESEGCSLSTNKDEYRDYSTYFFAPLNGATRQNEAISLRADFNKDGVVSYIESHQYAVMIGESKDISRSTSEMYLENWTPWYLRWGYGGENKDSSYWKIAEYLSGKHNLPMDGKVLMRKKSELQSKIDQTVNNQNKLVEQINEVSKKLRGRLKRQWPQLSHPYTASYINLIKSDGEMISTFLRQLDSYSEMVDIQDSLQKLQGMELTLEREKAQIDKIIRMKRLARLQNEFNRFASDSDKQIYSRLLNCENGAFFSVQK